MIEPPVQPPKRIGDHIRAVGAYSILLGFLALGATIATIFWSSSNTNLQTDLRRSNDELAQARAELAEVKSEYAQYHAQIQESSVQESAEPMENSTSGVEHGKQGGGQERVEISVATEGTESLFGGDLLLSLVGTPFGDDPPRHKVLATIGSPGTPSAKIEREDVGYELIYSGKNSRYAIRITAARTFSATFFVTRLDGTNEATPNTVSQADG